MKLISWFVWPIVGAVAQVLLVGVLLAGYWLLRREGLPETTAAN
jgi:uncharacterized membrane protein AbrB (regulator of aidB expression)